MKVILKQFLPYWVVSYFISTSIFPQYFRNLQFASLYLLAAFIVILGREKKLSILAKDYWMLALIVLIGLSYFWSVATHITFAYFRNSIMIFVISGYTATTYTPKQIISYMSKILGLIVFISLIYIVALPEIGISERGAWRGVFPHQSYFAAVVGLATISIFNSFNLLSKRNKSNYLKVLNTALIAGCFVVMWYTQARTPLLALITSFAILLFFYLKKFRSLKTRTQCFLVLAYFLLIVVPLVFLLKDLIIVELLGKSPNLSGRDQLWSLLSDKIAERPFLGYGQGAFWHNQRLSWEIISKTPWAPDTFNAHSSYYACLLGLGFVGLFLLFVTVVTVVRRNIVLFYKHNQLEARWGVQIIVFMLVASYSDTWIGFLNRNIGWFTFNIISLMSIRQIQKVRTTEIIHDTNPYLHRLVQSCDSD